MAKAGKTEDSGRRGNKEGERWAWKLGIVSGKGEVVGDTSETGETSALGDAGRRRWLGRGLLVCTVSQKIALLESGDFVSRVVATDDVR